MTHPDLSTYDGSDPEIAAHLDGCAECRAELETLDALRRAAHPPDDDVDLDGFFEQRLRPVIAPRRPRRRLLAAAVLLCTFAAGMAAGRTLTPPPTVVVDQPRPAVEDARQRQRRALRAASEGDGIGRGLLGLAAMLGGDPR